MYLDAIANYNSTFYAYANGDILFDESLVKTLTLLSKPAKQDPKMLVVGRRSNYKVDTGRVFQSTDEIRSAMKSAELFTVWAEDYFIYPKLAVDWNHIPDVVVGM